MAGISGTTTTTQAPPLLNLLKWFTPANPTPLQQRYLVNGRGLPGAPVLPSERLHESVDGFAWSEINNTIKPFVPDYSFNSGAIGTPFATDGTIAVVSTYYHDLWTTTDGLAWDLRYTFALPASTNAVDYNSINESEMYWTGTQFVKFVSSQDATPVTNKVSSPDGITWQTDVISPVPWMVYATSGRSRYESTSFLKMYVVGSTMTAVWWTTAVASNGSVGTKWTSTDNGTTWSAGSPVNPSIPIRTPQWTTNGGTFSFTSTNGKTFVFTRSGTAWTTDFTTWTQITVPFSYTVGGFTTGYADHSADALVYANSQYFWLRRLLLSGPGTLKLMTSSDGTTWTERGTDNSITWLRKLTTNSVIANQNNTIVTSNDGVTWTATQPQFTAPQAVSINRPPQCFSFGGSGYVVGTNGLLYKVLDNGTRAPILDVRNSVLETSDYPINNQDATGNPRLFGTNNFVVASFDVPELQSYDYSPPTSRIPVLITSSDAIALSASNQSPFTGVLSRTTSTATTDDIVFADQKTTKMFTLSTGTWKSLGLPTLGGYHADEFVYLPGQSVSKIIRVDAGDGVVKQLDPASVPPVWSNVVPNDQWAVGQYDITPMPNKATGPQFFTSYNNDFWAKTVAVLADNTIQELPYYFKAVTWSNATFLYYAVEQITINSSTFHFKVYTSADGLSWTLLSFVQSIGSYSQNTIQDILVSSASNIVVVRKQNNAVSTDGGSTWTHVSAPGGAGNEFAKYFLVWNSIVYITVYRYQSPPIFAYKSADGGLTYSAIPNPPTINKTGGGSDLFAELSNMQVVNDDRVVLLLNHNDDNTGQLILSQTSSGGEQWSTAIHPAGTAYTWYSTDTQIVRNAELISRTNSVDGHKLFRTINGVDWTVVPTPAGEVRAVRLGNNRSLVISSNRSRALSTSTNNGVTWSATPPYESVLDTLGTLPPPPQMVQANSDTDQYVRGAKTVWYTSDFLSYSVVARIQDLSPVANDWFVHMSYNPTTSKLVLITMFGYVFTGPSGGLSTWTASPRITCASAWNTTNTSTEPYRQDVIVGINSGNPATAIYPLIKGVTVTYASGSIRAYVAYGEGFAFSVSADLITWTPTALSSNDAITWTQSFSAGAPYYVGVPGLSDSSVPVRCYGTIEKIEFSETLNQLVVVVSQPDSSTGGGGE